jgi:hypothetical protein
LYTADDELRRPLYVMIAWQNFTRDGWLKQIALRQHRGFSVDREGTDLQAVRQAVEILQQVEPRRRALTADCPSHRLPDCPEA